MKYALPSKQDLNYRIIKYSPLMALAALWLLVVITLLFFADWLIIKAYEIGLII